MREVWFECLYPDPGSTMKRSPEGPGTRRNIVAPLALVALAAGVFGCGEPATEAGVEVQVDTLPNGAVEIMNLVEPAEAERPRWTAVEELRIGPPDIQAPRQLVVDDEGDGLLVLDTGLEQLKAFDADGAEEYAVDLRDPQSGIGRQIWGMARARDGGLLIRDGDGFSRLGPDRQWEERHPLPFSPDRPYESRWDDEGRLAEWRFDWFYGPGEDQRTVRAFLVRHAPGFDRADSLTAVEHISDLLPGTAIEPPQHERVLWHLDPNGEVWVARSREYRLVRRTLGGDTTLTFTRSFVPVEITEEEKAGMADAWSNVDDVPVDAVPETREVLRRIVTDAEGRVFVFPMVAGHSLGSVIDVFEEGVFLGRLALPVSLNVNFQFPVIRNGYIHGVVEERPREYHVVRLRIEGW